MSTRKIPISLPDTGEEEWLALKEPIMSGWLTQGPKVAEFETAFANKHQVKYAIATTSCTTGLHLALLALGVGPGDEVIVPAFTWVATANVVLYCGATPVLVDIEKHSFNIDPDKVKEKLSARTKAIIVVHLFGRCADVDAIREVIGDGVKIVEDAACAAGAEYKGISAGALGDVGVFSFHPRKTITTGEGGMITTSQPQLAENLRMMRNHGASISEEQRHEGAQPYILPDFNMVGFNYRMTDMQGAVGLAQLKKLDEYIIQRRHWAEYYNQALSAIGWLRTPGVSDMYNHGWQSYVCYVDESISPAPRNEIMRMLQDKGVSTRPGTHAIHTLKTYKDRYSYKDEDYPMASDCSNYSMAIPLHNRMNEKDYQYIVSSLAAVE